MSEQEDQVPEIKSKARFYTGIVVLVLALAMPIWGSAIVALLGLPPAVNTILIGLSIAGGPDLLMVVAAAIMGKESLNYILGLIGGWFKRNFKLSEHVSKKRYMIGLILFWGAILLRWGLSFLRVQPDAAQGSVDWGLWFLLSFEVVLIASVFVLGARFWEKLTALFRYDGETVPEEG